MEIFLPCGLFSGSEDWVLCVATRRHFVISDARCLTRTTRPKWWSECLTRSAAMWVTTTWLTQKLTVHPSDSTELTFLYYPQQVNGLQKQPPFPLCPLKLPPLSWQWSTKSASGLPGHSTLSPTHFSTAVIVLTLGNDVARGSLVIACMNLELCVL